MDGPNYEEENLNDVENSNDMESSNDSHESDVDEEKSNHSEYALDPENQVVEENWYNTNIRDKIHRLSYTRYREESDHTESVSYSRDGDGEVEVESFSKIPLGDITFDELNTNPLFQSLIGQLYSKNLFHLSGVNLNELRHPCDLSDRLIISKICFKYLRLLLTHKNENGKIYFINLLDTMKAKEQQSLVFEYNILEEFEPILAKLLVEAPHQMLNIFNEATNVLVSKCHPSFFKVVKKIFIRINGLSNIHEISSLRADHLGSLIRVKYCTVNSGTCILQQVVSVMYECGQCGESLGPFTQEKGGQLKPSLCITCQSKGPFTIVSDRSNFQSYQKITIQGPTEGIEAARAPRLKDVILQGSLCDSFNIGNDIDLTGVYTNIHDESLSVSTGFPVYSTVIIANHIVVLNSPKDITFDEQIVKEIKKLSRRGDIFEKIIASICPSIKGQEEAKTAIALALFGGCPKSGDLRIRGDIHVLLCGDPGTAKSQLLSYVKHISPKAIYTTGRGSTAAGLTLSVQKATGGWKLMAGAMPMADGGVCLIDEFDKMSENDRSAIHEAMEQQTTTIAKANIFTKLSTRCAVIAALNPKCGRYNRRLDFRLNVELSDPIIDRFDIICVMIDSVDKTRDKEMARFVARSHIESHCDVDVDELIELANSDEPIVPIGQELLRNYIFFAKQNYQPALPASAEKNFSNFYAHIRKQSATADKNHLVSLRFVNAMIRCAQAHAKMHLRSEVNKEDQEFAKKVVLTSYLAMLSNRIRKNSELNDQTISRVLNSSKKDN